VHTQNENNSFSAAHLLRCRRNLKSSRIRRRRMCHDREYIIASVAVVSAFARKA